MTTRRNFIGSAMGVSMASLLPSSLMANRSKPLTRNRIRPKSLKKGSTIGLVAPGYTFTTEVLKNTVTLLKDMGYKVYHTERLQGKNGYFSNTDQLRADDVNHMFANSDVDAILCIRGGYGCTRILNMLDYDLIRENPKALIGFSDVTALLNVITSLTGVITFHGPVGSTLDDEYSQKWFQRIMHKPYGNLKIKNPKRTKVQKKNPEYEKYVINQGNVSGELCGGSLTLINALMGTPYEIDFTNKIVCIEDVGEAPYRIDRMLTQLLEGRTFKHAAGIVFGVCSGCDHSNNPNSFSLKEVIVDRVKPLGIPAVYGMGFGHIPQNFTFPIGVEANLSTDNMILELKEAAVS